MKTATRKPKTHYKNKAALINSLWDLVEVHGMPVSRAAKNLDVHPTTASAWLVAERARVDDQDFFGDVPEPPEVTDEDRARLQQKARSLIQKRLINSEPVGIQNEVPVATEPVHGRTKTSLMIKKIKRLEKENHKLREFISKHLGANKLIDVLLQEKSE